jgi:parvulin-like peptidyl-prolyl isomerase
VFVFGGQVLVRWLRPGGTPSEVLAVVDGKPITLQAFQGEMSRRGGEAAFPSPDQRRGLLDDMIRVAVLAANATTAGYANDAEVKRNIQQLLADKYERQNIDVPLADVQVSDGEIEDYYRRHASAFTSRESVHAALILVAVPPKASDDERALLQQRAQHIRELALARSGNPSFADLARQYSDEPSSRAAGGDLGWIELGKDDARWDPAVTRAIFDLDDAVAVSQPIATASGIYIAKLLERKTTVVQPLNEVRASIRQQLMRSERQRRAASFYAGELAKVHVSVNEAGVAAMEAAERALVDVPHGTPLQPKS